MSESELLASYRPWLRAVATRMTHPDRVDDLMQEGWVALWRAHHGHDGRAPLDWWLKYKAHGRMCDVLRNWATAPHVPVPDDDTLWTGLTVDLGDVEAAYHHGEVAAAIDRLTSREREYVMARFWGGERKPELIARFGYEPGGLWRTARVKLRAELGHLAGAS